MPDVETASDSVAMKYAGKYCHRISWCSSSSTPDIYLQHQ